MAYKYFTEYEFERTNHQDLFEHVPDNLRGNMCKTLSKLDKVREAFGKPIVITSGYRSPSLNMLVGGVKNSYHTRAKAVDIHPMDNTPEECNRLYVLLGLCHPLELKWIKYGKPTTGIHVTF